MFRLDAERPGDVTPQSDVTSRGNGSNVEQGVEAFEKQYPGLRLPPWTTHPKRLGYAFGELKE